MFKFKSDIEFTHKVKFLLPVDGGHSDQEFKATFRVIEVDRFIRAETLDDEQDLLREIIVGFEDIVDDDDNPVPYSDELRERVIALPFVHRALIQTYLVAVSKSHAAT